MGGQKLVASSHKPVAIASFVSLRTQISAIKPPGEGKIAFLGRLG
jgi:hypothetical protein